jgi:suppressor for copper-sensitivity B
MRLTAPRLRKDDPMEHRRRFPTYRYSPAVAAALLAAVLAPWPATGQGGPESAKKATLKVLADRTAYEPGTAARLAAVVEIERGWHVNSNTPTYDWLIPTELTFELPAGFAAPRLEYPAHEMQKFAFTEEPIAVYDGRVTVKVELDVPADAAEGPLEIPARLRYQACDHESCLPPTDARVTAAITVGGGGEPANEKVFAAFAGGAAPPASPHADRGLFAVLLLAVVGGLLLNAMPCVLPVLSLKVFGLVQSAARGRSHVVKGCLATAAGVLISFWALAGLAVGAKLAGEAVGWGMQFQHPGFVTFLVVVVVLFALNMWGLFEIPLPASLSRLGGSGPSEGVAGHLGSGLFATLMATPCSAPFLGTAVGFALAQRPALIFAIFTAIGVGLALPYLLLAVVPGAARWLPRPGDWMVTFKGVMGFLLAATAVWLFYVLAAQVSAESLAYVQLALLGLALFTWLVSRDGAARWTRRLATAGVVATAVAAIVLAMNAPAAAAEGKISKYHDWLAFDEAQADALRGEGRLVFIDFTADWCLTCKTNERLVLETAEIAAAFVERGVVPMKADWTNPDDAIAAFLARFGKSAVPFYVLYRPGREPHVFSEILTRQQVLDALAEAG